MAELPATAALVTSVAVRLERLAGAPVSELRPVGGDHGVRHYRARLADGRELFVKAVADTIGTTAALAGRTRAACAALAAEARGLRWLSEAGAVPIPELIFIDHGLLGLIWLPQAGADRDAADRFGRDLARLHATGAPSFGAPWRSFIAGLPLPNCQDEVAEAEDAASSPARGGAVTLPGSGGAVTLSGSGGAVGGPGQDGEVTAPDCGGGAGSAGPAGDAGRDSSWPRFYAECRLLPYLRLARDAGILGRADVTLIEAVAGPANSPAPQSRQAGSTATAGRATCCGQAGVAGWSIRRRMADTGRLTWPMLALFGAPYLDRMLAAYAELVPLADGWQRRVPLHQLHPLLVHVCLFGASYRDAALAAARAALAG